MTSNKSVVAWLEEVLQAERRQVELTLATRHAALVRELGPLLQGNDSRSLPPAQDVVAPRSGWFSCEARPMPNVPIENIKGGNTEISHLEASDANEVIPEEEDDYVGGTTPEKEEEEDLGWRGPLIKLLESWYFDLSICAIIILNSVCIGIETSLELEGKDTALFDIIEHVFLAIYIVELCLRYVAFGCRVCLRDGWVVFDTVLVVMGVLSLYVLGPIFDNLDNGGNQVVKKLAGLLVMRTLRLFRLARLLKLVMQFRTLYKLVRGLLGTGETIFFAFGLIMLILYIFSCMVLELTKDLRQNAEVGDLVLNNFRNIPMTMLSMIQFVTIDSIAGMYYPLIQEDFTLVFFFVPVILIVSISLMNLVTAVIVEGAIQAGADDAEADRKYKQYQFLKMLPDLRAKFREMDKDGDHLLTLTELENCPAQIKHDLQKYVDGEGLHELFEMIDTDESGVINSDEFCDGVAKLVNSESPVELIRILKQLKQIRKELVEIKSGEKLTEAQLAVPPPPIRISGAV